MLKKGDLVINITDEYRLTNKHTVCVVEEILSESFMLVRVVKILDKASFYTRALREPCLLTKDEIGEKVYKAYKVRSRFFKKWKDLEGWD